jgi:hypothetical protein
MFRIITTFLFLITSYNLVAQSKSNFGIGILVGYKAPAGNSGLIVSYQIKNKIEMYAGIGNSKYQGLGYGGGVRFIALRKPKWSPFIGLGYTYINGDKKVLVDNGVETRFEIPTKIYISSDLGLSLNIRLKEEPGLSKSFSYIKILAGINYRYSLSNNKALYNAGDQRADLERLINRAIRGGIGAFVGIVFYLGEKEKKVQGKE